jgi:hypothetical protein
MPSDATLVIDADTGKAIKELVRLSQQQQKATDDLKKFGQTAKDTKADVGRMGDAIGKLGGSTLVIGGVTAALLALETQAKRATTAIESTADAANGLGVLTLDPKVKEMALTHGTGHGFTGNDSIAAYKAMVDQYGSKDLDKLGRAAEEVFDIGELGVPIAAASRLIQAGAAVGQDPTRTSAQVGSAIQGGISGEALGKAADSLTEFRDFGAGIAAAVGMKQAGANEDKMLKSLAALSETLMTENNLSKAVSQKTGIAIGEGSEFDVMRTVADLIPASMTSKQIAETYKLSKIQAEAIDATTDSWQKISAEYYRSKPEGFDTGLEDLILQQSFAVDPQLRMQDEIEASREIAKVAPGRGAMGTYFQDIERRRTKAGARLNQAPGGTLFTDDQGRFTIPTMGLEGVPVVGGAIGQLSNALTIALVNALNMISPNHTGQLMKDMRTAETAQQEANRLLQQIATNTQPTMQVQTPSQKGPAALQE